MSFKDLEIQNRVLMLSDRFRNSRIFFLVQNKWYVKQNLRGRWSGFGMARSWDRSQLIWDESQQIVRADTQPTQTIFFNHSLSINPKSWPWYHLGRWAVQRQGQHQQCQGQERSPLQSAVPFPFWDRRHYLILCEEYQPKCDFLFLKYEIDRFWGKRGGNS